jgi:ABC-type branched-subunit amino acid transport system permease subunit
VFFVTAAALAGLAGGLYGYVRLSFWQIASVFSPSWTFDAVLSVVVGGAGTLFAPVVGSVVLFLPQGLMGGADLLHRRKTSPRPEAGREARAR